jgi:uncharacterized protein (TIGR00369 family)
MAMHREGGGFMSAKKINPNRRSRTVNWQDPMITAQAMSNMNGLDFLRATIDGRIPAPPVSGLIGLRLAEVDVGHVVFEVDPGEYHYNPAGMVHGGIAFTALDSAAACAVQSTLPMGVAVTTLEIKINYLRPITIESGPMRGESTLIHKGSRTAVAEAKMVDANGLLYAYAVATCLIFEATKEGVKAAE